MRGNEVHDTPGPRVNPSVFTVAARKNERMYLIAVNDREPQIAVRRQFRPSCDGVPHANPQITLVEIGFELTQSRCYPEFRTST
jgi:hypothetical protein